MSPPLVLPALGCGVGSRPPVCSSLTEKQLPPLTKDPQPCRPLSHPLGPSTSSWPLGPTDPLGPSGTFRVHPRPRPSVPLVLVLEPGAALSSSLSGDCRDWGAGTGPIPRPRLTPCQSPSSLLRTPQRPPPFHPRWHPLPTWASLAPWNTAPAGVLCWAQQAPRWAWGPAPSPQAPRLSLRPTPQAPQRTPEPGAPCAGSVPLGKQGHNRVTDLEPAVCVATILSPGRRRPEEPDRPCLWGKGPPS